MGDELPNDPKVDETDTEQPEAESESAATPLERGTDIALRALLRRNR
jgi:hypothetical protein